jgi:hypothetical protein
MKMLVNAAESPAVSEKRNFTAMFSLTGPCNCDGMGVPKLAGSKLALVDGPADSVAAVRSVPALEFEGLPNAVIAANMPSPPRDESIAPLPLRSVTDPVTDAPT